jgi:hypothetical protein
MLERMPIVSPTFVVYVLINGGSYMKFNLKAVSLLDRLESHTFKLRSREILFFVRTRSVIFDKSDLRVCPTTFILSSMDVSTVDARLLE